MKNTTISWCDHTFNPWLGCRHVSPGCENCFAEAWGRRFGVKWGGPRRSTSEAYWRQPLAWNRAAEKRRVLELHSVPAGTVHDFRRPRVFCGSLCDWLDDEVPVEWLADLLDLIRRTPNLDWQLLTKRPQNWRERIYAAWGAKESQPSDTLQMLKAWLDGRPPENCCLGASVEDQPRADERIPQLLAIPARVRFLSVEPMLGPVNIRIHESLEALLKRNKDVAVDWVICGCESGLKRRPMETEWAIDLCNQCRAAGVPFFAKQMEVDGHVCHDLAQFPASLRVREFPT